MSPGHVLDQPTPFAADVSDEAGPDTTGATAGHVDETDLLDSSVPLDPWTPEEDYPPGPAGVRAWDGGNRARPRGWASTELDERFGRDTHMTQPVPHQDPAGGR